MSRDLLTTTNNASTTESRPATRTTQTEKARPVAAELAANLLERVERGWSGSRPESQSFWQLAGE
ncbi:MAG TPA: hypothetical protein VNM87_08565 [Candidatus Udaeobacter sp.]|nr:hypothetical protein [Candidatus Udaeobacter sp.]